MFQSVLIANRGEIACRIIRTTRALGISSVAIYHFEDRHAPHVAMADQAFEISGTPATAAYLDATQIIELANRVGVDALHPGYGFLSENSAFAAAVEQSGIQFIGPQASVIELMGNKVKSREFAAEAGVPVALSVSKTGTLDDFIAAVESIGYPLLLKAAAGGGGKGMSIVQNRDELRERASIATAEAERYFADGHIYAERYVHKARHIEVQVLGDGNGNAIHLFERECSIQRRFQKIIEESPAPNLDSKLRDRICTAAVDLAKRSNYRNAGTVEFILDDSGEFYFLEMNTRLQVEHPVTEMVTGVDLVEAQFRIASGEALGLKQEDIRQHGHAIECRICAEIPTEDFKPATGTARVLNIPEGDGVRFDSGLREGQIISASFDSMLGKLIVHDTDRAAAIVKMQQALQEFVLLGVDNNVDYLARIIDHPVFKNGRFNTHFVPDYAEELQSAKLTEPETHALLIAAALATDEFRRMAYDIPEPYASMGGWRN